MKKILFASTALLAAGAFASSAQASDPIKLSLGGYMEYYVAVTDQDDDSAANTGAQNFDVIGDAEVFFKGKTTLDNGMTVGVDVQLEAGTRSGGDDIDESYMYLQGKYGKLIIGAENDVAYKMGMSAPSVSAQGAAGSDDSISDYLPNSSVSRNMVYSTITGDANKLSYISPRMYGIQVGASYVPSGSTSGDDGETGSYIDRTGNFDDAVAFAVNYKETFSGVGVNAGVAYSVIDTNNPVAGDADDVSSVSGGLVLSYMGFSVGGAVMVQNADEGTDYDDNEGTSWNAGVSYKEGPYGVSFTYYNSSVEGSTDKDGQDDETQIYQLAGTYALGKGVTLIADLDYLNAEDESTATNAASLGNEGAIGAAIGLKLKF